MREGRDSRPDAAAARRLECSGLPAASRAAAPTAVRLAAALAASVLAAACSFDYGQALAEDLADRTPNAVFTGFTHTVVQDNTPLLRIEAESAEIFDRKSLVRLSGVSFTELRDGRVLARGSAEGATLRTDTEDAEFFGSVNLRSEEEGVSIRTGYLSWNASDRVLSASDTETTEIERDDGSFLRGSGFRVDARRKGISFSGPVEGLLVRRSAPEDGGEAAAAGPAGAAPDSGEPRE